MRARRPAVVVDLEAVAEQELVVVQVAEAEAPGQEQEAVDPAVEVLARVEELVPAMGAEQEPALEPALEPERVAVVVQELAQESEAAEEREVAAAAPAPVWVAEEELVARE
jgi:hypothetical protein